MPYGAQPPAAYGDAAGQPWGYPAPAQRQSRKPLLIGCGVAAALLLALGGTAAYLVYDRVSSLGTHRLVPPDEFKGMSRTGNEATEQEILRDLATSWNDNPATKGKITPAVAVYGSETRGRFIFGGGYGKVADADSEMDQLFEGLGDGGTSLGARKSYDPGPLGGKLECAPLTGDRLSYGFCGWSDGSSVAFVMHSAQTSFDLDAVAADVREFRGIAEVPE
jgi:hypothetical protein